MQKILGPLSRTEFAYCCVSMTSPCSLNRSTTFLQNWRHIMEIILLYILFMAMAQMPFGYAHGVVLTLFMHDVFNDSKLKER